MSAGTPMAPLYPKWLRQLIRNAAALFGVVHQDPNLGPVHSEVRLS